ncbi:hypothetical protein BDV59DRAFT_174395 [Aspergillus ambiguus]|uniref:uncharacterized protein n=1 Tax=Aspergillus ambiguus TaxID=176160 RepID=UPI003CCE2D4E
MPTSSTSSPVKRPALGRRAISSHAVVTRSSSTLTDWSDTSSSTTVSHQKRPHHHRAHIVGGGHHRAHHRNPSGKNLNKLQRHLSHLTITSEGGHPGRHHQRKKSAPATPAASPRGTHHVRWDGAVLDDTDSHHTRASMKKNYSSPALQRNASGVLGKKALVTDRPHTSSGKKKTVGFELADSDNDDAEWEDTTQSPESTRRSSVAQSKESVENPAAVLVDPLTFVKRPYPQFPRATSLPESTSKSFGENHLSEEEDEDTEDSSRRKRSHSPEPDDPQAAKDHGDIAARLLSPSHSAKAPPAMSSISAIAEPTMVDSVSRTTSLTNLSLAPTTHDAPRRPVSSSNVTLANTPGAHTHATSSSIEGGVSRFIKAGLPSTSRTDSDPNTPSSFLPHYHPQTPPSPNRTSSRRPRASPPSRPPGAEPPSRTQQKLWLQRTAALNTSPPDSHGASVTSSPAVDASFIAASQARPGAAFEAGRALMNGVPRPGAPTHGTETKHVRKTYEKTAMELTVVRRFQTPTADSFQRLNTILNTTIAEKGADSSLGKPIKSAPALTDLKDTAGPRLNSASPEPKQLLSRKQSNLPPSASQSYLEADDEPTETDLVLRPKNHPAHRILSTSDEGIHNPAEEDATDTSRTGETEMMIRRMWESREVATSG